MMVRYGVVKLSLLSSFRFLTLFRCHFVYDERTNIIENVSMRIGVRKEALVIKLLC